MVAFSFILSKSVFNVINGTGSAQKNEANEHIHSPYLTFKLFDIYARTIYLSIMLRFLTVATEWSKHCSLRSNYAKKISRAEFTKLHFPPIAHKVPGFKFWVLAD